MREAADAARDAPAKMITEINDVKAAANAYTRVQISGEWLPDRQFLWDNRTHKGRAGFEVIIPMRTADGLLVLINRGWLPLGVTRAELPDVSYRLNLLTLSRLSPVTLLARPKALPVVTRVAVMRSGQSFCSSTITR